MRSLWHLSRHLTARADDNHAAPRSMSRRTVSSLTHSHCVRARVRFLAYHRIKPHVPPLVRAPVNSFEFHRCGILNAFAWRRINNSHTASIHRLPCGLPGYLILFDTRTFEPQRQWRAGHLPSRSEFFVISKHFTATPRIPASLRALKACSFNCTPQVEPAVFTTDLQAGLRSL